MLLGDFYYKDIEYDPQTHQAVRLLICEPEAFQPGTFFWVSRAQIINLIEDGYTIEPLPKNGQLLQTRQVLHLVCLNGEVYLRNDGAVLPADQLNGHGAGHTLDN